MGIDSEGSLERYVHKRDVHDSCLLFREVPSWAPSDRNWIRKAHEADRLVTD